MQNGHAGETPDVGKTPAGAVRGIFKEAVRFWEPRRVIYNLILTAVVVAWVVATWPHFRAILTLQSLLLLSILGLIANICYCAAYVVDIPMQASALSNAWRRGRWGLWAVGTLCAIIAANYWIADEIYLYVR